MFAVLAGECFVEVGRGDAASCIHLIFLYTYALVFRGIHVKYVVFVHVVAITNSKAGYCMRTVLRSSPVSDRR